MGGVSSVTSKYKSQENVRIKPSTQAKHASVETKISVDTAPYHTKYVDLCELTPVEASADDSFRRGKNDDRRRNSVDTVIESFKHTPDSLGLFQPALQHLSLIAENPCAESLFMKFLKDGVWIDSIMNRFEAEYESQHAHQGSHRNETLSSKLTTAMSIKFKQFALVPKNMNSVAPGLTPDDVEDEDEACEELEQQIFQQNHALELIKTLKIKETNEHLLKDDEIVTNTIFDLCSSQTIAGIVIITALYEFVYHCHEFKRYLISNFENICVENVKFNSIKANPNKPKKAKSSENFILLKQKEYYYDLYNQMLTHTLQQYHENSQELLSNSLIMKLGNSLENFPFAFSLSRYQPDAMKRDWRLYYCNDEYCNLTQYNFLELYQKNPKHLLHNEHTNTSLLAKMKDHLGSLKTMKIGLINAKKDQSEFYNFMILKPVFSYHKNHHLTNSSSPHHNHHKGGHDGVNASNCAYYMAMCYDVSSDNARVSDLKLMEDCAVLLSYIL